MQTLFILEFQANNDGTASALPIVDSEGNVWRGYKQTLRHGHEVVNAE